MKKKFNLCSIVFAVSAVFQYSDTYDRVFANENVPFCEYNPSCEITDHQNNEHRRQSDKNAYDFASGRGGYLASSTSAVSLTSLASIGG